MTAQWESQLEAISKRELRYKDFMDPMVTTLTTLIDQVSQLRFDGLRGKGSRGQIKRKTARPKQGKTSPGGKLSNPKLIKRLYTPAPQ